MVMRLSKTCPVPAHEVDRLSNLLNQDILDTESEKDFDRITEIAKNLFDVPVALVSFIDKKRQWFKSCIGIEVTETERDIAFCAHTIFQEKTLIINDATQDERFFDNPLVVGGPEVRFYAGTPIRSEEGYNLGTVCVLDTKVRHDFNENDQKNLENLAALVSILLSHRKRTLLSEQKNLAKTEYVSYISHELRTPLNSIVSVANILKDKKKIAEREMALIQSLAMSADSLMEIINSVLDINKIENREFNLNKEYFPLARVFLEIESMMGIKAMEKDLIFEVNYTELENVIQYGDKVRLKQILMNLVGNAIKFTDIGMVSLKAGYRISDSLSGRKEIEIQVSDTGAGINKQYLGKIFEAYEQAGTADNNDQGSGLGLAITRELVEKMGGTINVESLEGFGTKVFVRIPDDAGCSVNPEWQQEVCQSLN